MVRLLAIITVLFLQFSVCTGGVLSAASVLAASVSTENFTTASLMTPEGDVFLCESSTPDMNQPLEVSRRSSKEPVCENGEKCLQQTATDTHERANIGGATELLWSIVVPVTASAAEYSPVPDTPLARAGPLFSDAIHRADQIQKRE